ncbi:MAG: protein kinase, partial [Anaerolineales bacterium]|nr:protein kinase [Anaerolineales bacterium]
MTRLSKYTLQEPPLGRGGYGTVYKAYDEVLKVERAIKVLHPQLAADPEFIGRFRQEAQVAARLEHPHIVPVYDLGEDQGRFFLVMKLMPGGSLKELLEKEGGLPFKHALEILKQIANALDFAYNQSEKLIHRDIKPGNILFEKDGSARLADFGFAKALASTSSASISLSGELLGTPAYMAPELWEGKAPTPVVDVYSLACVFYEMITGEALFAGASPLEIMRRQALEEPQFPDEWPDGVPSSTSAVLHQALAKSPQARYLVASDFAANLKNISTDAQVRDEATEQIQPEADAEQTASQMVAPQTKAPEPRERRQPTKERPVTASSSKQKALLFLWIALAAVGVILLCFGTWFVGSKLIFSGDSEPAAILVDTPKMTMLATTSATATPLPVLAGTAIPWPQRAISDENAASFAQLARWGKGSINQVVWSPNQDLLAVASSIGIYIYDSTTLQNVRFIDTSTWVKSVVFSPDGGMLASIGEGIRLWRVSDGALIAIFEEHTAGVNSVVF